MQFPKSILLTFAHYSGTDGGPGHSFPNEFVLVACDFHLRKPLLHVKEEFRIDGSINFESVKSLDKNNIFTITEWRFDF